MKDTFIFMFSKKNTQEHYFKQHVAKTFFRIIFVFY